MTLFIVVKDIADFYLLKGSATLRKPLHIRRRKHRTSAKDDNQMSNLRIKSQVKKNATADGFNVHCHTLETAKYVVHAPCRRQVSSLEAMRISQLQKHVDPWIAPMKTMSIANDMFTIGKT